MSKTLFAVVLTAATAVAADAAGQASWDRDAAFTFADAREAAASRALDVPGAPLRLAQPIDWLRVRQEWEASFRDFHAAVSARRRDPDVAAAFKPLREISELSESIRRDTRATADRQLRLFRQNPVPGTAPGEMERRVEGVFAARMLYLYGFLLPQTVNEGFTEWARDRAIPGCPFALYLTPSRYCDLYSGAGKELDDLTERIDPSFFPPETRQGRSICDPANWDPAWPHLQARPLPRP